MIRTLLAAIFSLFFPVRGKRRATADPAPTVRPCTPRVPAEVRWFDTFRIPLLHQHRESAAPEERKAMRRRLRHLDAAMAEGAV